MELFLYAVCISTASWLTLTEATCHHMLCKAVDEECSDEDTAQSYSSRRVLRGSAGKSGPKGNKGDVGRPGPPGTVNRNALRAMVDEEVNEAAVDLRQLTAKLQGQIESLTRSNGDIERQQAESDQITRSLRQQIRNLQLEVRELNETIKKDEGDQGRDQCRGITYKSKCYFTVVRSNAGVAFNAAKRMCNEQGAELADILTLEHENMVQDLIRNNIRGNSVQVWLGMTFKIVATGGPPGGPLPWRQDFLVELGTGSSVAASQYRWYGNPHPTYNYTFSNILMEASETSSGLINRKPTHSGSRGALCMKRMTK